MLFFMSYLLVCLNVWNVWKCHESMIFMLHVKLKSRSSESCNPLRWSQWWLVHVCSLGYWYVHFVLYKIVYMLFNLLFPMFCLHFKAVLIMFSTDEWFFLILIGYRYKVKYYVWRNFFPWITFSRNVILFSWRSFVCINYFFLIPIPVSQVILVHGMLNKV